MTGSVLALKRADGKEFSVTMAKSFIGVAVAAVFTVLVLFVGVISKDSAAISVKGTFNGIDLLRALFSGGDLSYYGEGIGELTVTMPTALNAVAAIGVLFFPALLVTETVLCVLTLRYERKGLVRAASIVSLAGALWCVIVYLVFLFAGTPAEDITGEAKEAYRVFQPEIFWLIAALFLALSALIRYAITAEKMKKLKRYLPSYLFMVVPLILIAVFSLYPILLQFILSFKDFKLGDGLFNSVWNGGKNFKSIFADPTMLKVIGNTLYISLLRLVAGTIPPLLLSIFLYDLSMRRTKRVVQTIVYIPHFFSWVIIYSIASAFLNEEGLISILLHTSMSPLNDPDWFLTIVIVTSIWKELGWGTILYMAALSGVQPELYEAAKLDGAGPWQRIVHITLPSIASIIIYLLIINLGNILKSAGGEQLLLFYGALTKDKATVIDTWLVWTGMQQLEYGIGAAMSFFQSAIGMLLVFLCNSASKKMTGIGMW